VLLSARAGGTSGGCKPCGSKPQLDSIKAFSETDFTDDLKSIDVPVLVLHGDDDQIVPIAAAALKTIKLLPHGILKVCPGADHGMCSTHADKVNADILVFVRGEMSDQVPADKRALKSA
jgi:non-heme chloroperoxidase